MKNFSFVLLFSFLALASQSQLSVSPSSGCQGSSFTVTITNAVAFGSSSACVGTYAYVKNGSNVNVADCNNFSAHNSSSSSVTATLSIPANLAPGSYGFTLGVCGSIYSCSNCFTVLPLPSAVSISPVNPASACLGASVNLTCSALNAISYQWTLSGNDIQGAQIASYAATQSGVYACKAINACGTTASQDSSTVVVIDPGVPTINQTGQTLNANSATAVSYQWYLSGNLINNATSNSYNPTQDGAYTVNITDANGCSATSSPFNYSINSVVPSDIASKIEVHPNPAQNLISIYYSSASPSYIAIYNVSGREVYRNETVKSENSIDVSNLPKGIYTVKIWSREGSGAKKLIIE